MRQVTKKGLITAAAASGVLAAVTGSYAQASSGASGHSVNSPGVASGNIVQVPVHVPVNACGNTVNVIGALNPASGNTCVNGGHHHGGGQHGGGQHGGGQHGGQGQGGGNHGHGGSGAHGGAYDSPGVASGNTVQVPVDVPVNACGNSVNVVGVGNHTTGNECVNAGGGGHEWPGHPGHKPPHQPGDHDGAHKPPSRPGHPGGDDCDHKPPAGDHDKPAGHKPGHETPGKDKPAEHAPAGHKPAQADAAHIPAPQVKDAHKGAPMAAPAKAPAASPAAKAVELAHTGAGQLGMAGAASAGLLLGGAVIYRRARAGQN